MPKKSGKTGRARKDLYWNMAHDQGFRSRAAYKLAQLNRKDSFLQKADTLVDLCAAPGGWLQIARKTMPVSSTIVGVDLVPIKHIPGVKTLVGDICLESTVKAIKRELPGTGKADVVLHDGAPNVGGQWGKDAYIQNVLVLHACRMACAVLVPKGVFVTKIFRSSDYTKLIFVLRELFEKVSATKPLASRQQSAEIFVVCKGYKAPKRIDPSFFNPRVVFRDLDDDEEPEVTAPGDEEEGEGEGTEENPLKKVWITERMKHKTTVQDPTKMKTNQEGYGNKFRALLANEVSITDFVKCPEPVVMVNALNKITFDPSEERFKNSKHTRPTHIAACLDIQSAGHYDKNALVKWHGKLQEEERDRLALKRATEDDDIADIPDDVEAIEMDSDSDIGDVENDMTRIQADLDAMHRREKKESKRKASRNVLRKLNVAQQLGLHPDDDGATRPDFDGFAPNADDEFEPPESEKSIDSGSEGREDDDESDEEVEGEAGKKGEGVGGAAGEKGGGKPKASDYFERMEKFLADQKRENRKALKEAEKEAEKQKKVSAAATTKLLQPGVESEEEDDDEDDEDASDMDTDGPAVEEEEDSDDGRIGDADDDDEDDEDDDDDADGNIRMPSKKRIVDKLMHGGGTAGQTPEDESVPVPLRDPQRRAKLLALAAKMLDKKTKRDTLESGIHRFTFNDDNLPDWFQEDERHHYFMRLPVTKEDVERERQRFREVDARPGKKVAEAMHRKRQKAKRLYKQKMSKEKESSGGGILDATARKELPTVRKLLRSRQLHTKKKLPPLDRKTSGEKRRDKDKLRTMKRKGGSAWKKVHQIVGEKRKRGAR